MEKLNARQYQWIGDVLLSNYPIDELIYQMIQEGFEYDEIRMFYPWLTNENINKYFKDKTKHHAEQEQRIKEIVNALSNY